jgi:hypothetical protein
MNRREFLISASAASCSAIFLMAKDRDHRLAAIKDPFVEDQHPTSVRGRELAGIARSIRIERNIEYVHRPERSLNLSVYRPGTDSGRPWPVILNCGDLAAWQWQTEDDPRDLDNLVADPTPDIYPQVFASQGYVVVSAKLRTSLEAPFPAQIQDCQAAFGWILAEAPSRGFDLRRIGLYGSSATGQLAALLALMNGAKPLLDPAVKLPWPLPVKAVCSTSGLYDFVYYRKDPGDGTLWPQIRQFLGGSYEDRPQVYREASPQYCIQDVAPPPFFLSHGIQDRRVPYSQTVRFHAALQRTGSPVEFEPINHYHHGVDPGDIPDPPYAVTDRRIYRFFDRYLKRT